MNMMFDKEKVRVGWGRPDEDDRHHQDWTEQLESTITELHKKIEEEPGTWVHDWGWTQTTNQPMSHKNHINEVKIFYSEDESEDDEVKIFYSEDERFLGAADDENDGESVDSEEEDQTSPKPIHRCSGRSWAPTQRTLKLHGQQWDFRRTGHRDGFGTTRPHLAPERQPIDLEPEADDQTPADDQPIRAPTPEVDLDDLVLESALDHKGRQLEPAAEGIGEPDPLVLARSRATMMPATQLLIPGPREQAQAQDQEVVLSIVKDWVRRGTVPRRLELDFGDDWLKAYVNMIPVLRLCQIPDQADLDILVKTDIQGRTQSERYCMPEDLIDLFIIDLHLRLTHYGVETTVLTMKHLVWFPSIWSRVSDKSSRSAQDVSRNITNNWTREWQDATIQEKRGMWRTMYTWTWQAHCPKQRTSQIHLGDSSATLTATVWPSQSRTKNTRWS